MTPQRPLSRPIEQLEDRTTPVGGLDTTFGTNGLVTVPLNTGSGSGDIARAVAVQPDGKVIVAGYFNEASVGRSDFVVRRLNANGTVDPTFGNGGRVMLVPTAVIGTTFVRGEATAVSLQADGSILVAGRLDGVDLTVVRLTADGQFSAGFGANGKASITIGNPVTPRAITTLADGRILLAGSSNNDFIAVELTANGQLDTTFGTAGRTTIGFDTATDNRVDEAASLVVQPDGRIILAGSSSQFDVIIHTIQTQSTIALARLTPDGRLDNSFDGDGKLAVALDRGTKADLATGVALRPDGRIVVSGSAGYSATQSDMVALQLRTDGSYDPTFGVGGKAFIQNDTAAGRDSRAAGLVLLPSGKIVLAGTAAPVGGLSGFAVARLNANGTVDTTFGTNGFVRANAVQDGGDTAYGVAAASLGRVVIVGSSAPAGRLFQLTSAIAGRFLVDTVVPGAVLVGGTANGAAVVLNPAGNGKLDTGPTVTFYPGFTGSIRTAVADVTGDGVADFIGGTGPGGQPRVAIIDGATGARIADFLAFEATFTGGVFVAAGDLNGDSKADVIVTPDRGGGPVVAVFNGAGLAAGQSAAQAQIVRFLGIADPNFRGGARVAIGDLNGDGTPDVVVAAGFQGGPRIAVFDGRSVAAGSSDPARLFPDFFAFESTLRDGAYVSAGDVNGDGKADLEFGAGPGGGPRVLIFDGAKLPQLIGDRQISSLVEVPPTDPSLAADFATREAARADARIANLLAGDATRRNGVRVASRDVDGDGRADLIVGSGGGDPSHVWVYPATGLTAAPAFDLDPFAATLADGVFVG